MQQTDARGSARNPGLWSNNHSQSHDLLSVERPFTALTSQTQNAYLSHERLDVYQLALKFHVGVMDLLPSKGQRVLRKAAIPRRGFGESTIQNEAEPINSKGLP